MGCDLDDFLYASRAWNFNPRTRVGCDNKFAQVIETLNISIHAPAWGATSTSCVPPQQPGFQSTHPRGVRLFDRNVFGVARAISIHAPAWGATWTQRLTMTKYKFQSTHPRGVRLSLRQQCCGRRDFNPRTRVGCDRRSARPGKNRFLFQSTHPRGVRHYVFYVEAYGGEFQSTHPRGVRRIDCIQGYTSTDFNPRTRVGCDRLETMRGQLEAVFQSTHPRGVRRQISHVAVSCGVYFNPRTRVGCDVRLFLVLSTSRLFQSTHPRGVRPDGRCCPIRRH